MHTCPHQPLTRTCSTHTHTIFLSPTQPAGALNDITPEGAALALESLQYVALNAGCRASLDKGSAIQSILRILDEQQHAPANARGSKAELMKQVTESFQKMDFRGDGSLSGKEFEEWYTKSERGDTRQAKAVFREVVYDMYVHVCKYMYIYI